MPRQKTGSSTEIEYLILVLGQHFLREFRILDLQSVVQFKLVFDTLRRFARRILAVKHQEQGFSIDETVLCNRLISVVL